MNLQNAWVYDIETYPNVFTLNAQMLNSDVSATWEISHFRDDRRELMQWFNHLRATQTVMIGFNNIGFDYPVIHALFMNPNMTVEQIYAKAMSIITSNDRFGNTIWDRDRFAPQLDLFKLHHFDNPAKSTSLKALQINMRCDTVVESMIAFGIQLTKEQVDTDLIPYNKHDTRRTKEFAHLSMEAINFRLAQVEKFGVDVLNWPDTKIGAKIMESRLGNDICYDFSTGRKVTRQSPRHTVALRDIIFPIVQFENPEFQRIKEYFEAQTLTSSELTDFTKLETKGVFSGLKANAGDLDFYFGTGGIHGSLDARQVASGHGWKIRDIDVASLYPSIAIVNNLYPEHLGEAFSRVYSELPLERKRWQKEKGKKCVEANALKLASNGVYGNSNNLYSVFYDPKFMLSITINGQLMLCMLAEKLMKVQTLFIIQINTDGITYFIHEDFEPQAAAICREWEALTRLTLEDADYKRMWIRDVNNYIAEGYDGSLKTKGAYWAPDPLDWAGSIGAAQPPAWHKDLSNVVSINAAVAAMVHNVPVEVFIRNCTNPYDFMNRAKVKRSDKLLHGGIEQQKTSRYYVAREGADLIKLSPPSGTPGTYKRKNKLDDFYFQQILREVGDRWDARIHTGQAGKPDTQGKYENRTTSMCAGYKTAMCNNVEDFRFDNVNYEWYISEAKKLIV